MRDATIDVRLADLIRPGQTLHPEDSLSKALHQLRLSTERALPVVAHGQLVGVVAEADVLAAAHRKAPPRSTARLAEIRVAEAMTSGVKTGRMEASLGDAWETMATDGLKVMPVLDGDGLFRGVVSRNDVLAALQRDLRPASVGGLATPLGVYLTTGHHRAGAGDLGLLLTGVLMAACHVVVVNGLEGLTLAARVAPPGWLAAIAEFVCYLLLLRATSLASFHAAEHQVVHAIERGEPLTLSHLLKLPREHPRCGTNIVALLFGAQLLLPLLPNPPVGVAAGLALILLWRRLGWVFQRVFTTKRASASQLKGAIAAGRELLAQYGARPAYRASALKRLWIAGFIQMVAGFGAVIAVVQLLNALFPQLGLLA